MTGESQLNMTEEQTRPPKLLENSFFMAAGLLVRAHFITKCRGWADGLDPTLVYPGTMAQSSFPLVLHMAKIHPMVWMLLTTVIFVRICLELRLEV